MRARLARGARALAGCEAGASVVEYALVLALIAVVVYGVFAAFGVSVQTMVTRIANAFGL